MAQKNRREYLTATVLDQDFLDRMHTGLENKLELGCDIDSPIGTLHFSDRAKYIGSTYYEPRLKFPTIKRTPGEWLSNTLEFSKISIEISNVDGKYNALLPGGASYAGWIGRSVTIQLGLADKAGTYKNIFEGFVTDVGGFGRSTETIRIVARDKFDRVNATMPTTVLSTSTFPKIDLSFAGQNAPVIYGDWTDANTFPKAPAGVPAYVVNGADPQVNFEDRQADSISFSSPGVVTAERHLYDEGDIIQFTTNGALPSPLTAATDYYVRNPGADTFNVSTGPATALINTTDAGSGDHTIQQSATQSRADIEFKIADHDLDDLLVGANDFWVKRGDDYYAIAAADLGAPGAGNQTITMQQDTGVTLIDGSNYVFDPSDTFWCKVEGLNYSTTGGEPVLIAKDILKNYGGLVDADFDSLWGTKTAGVKCRAHILDDVGALDYANSLFEQVLFETFIERDNLKFSINDLNFSTYDPNPSFDFKNWDVEEKSFRLQIDNRTNFNRAKALYNSLPEQNATTLATDVFRNQTAITQSGVPISKQITFPNLYVESEIEPILEDFIRLGSGYIEVITLNVTWRSMLLDIGDFVKVSIQIGSTIFEDVPCMVREIGYDPKGLRIPMKLWSFQMFPFSTWNPGYSGIVSGESQTITRE